MRQLAMDHWQHEVLSRCLRVDGSSCSRIRYRQGGVPSLEGASDRTDVPIQIEHVRGQTRVAIHVGKINVPIACNKRWIILIPFEHRIVAAIGVHLGVHDESCFARAAGVVHWTAPTLAAGSTDTRARSGEIGILPDAEVPMVAQAISLVFSQRDAGWPTRSSPARFSRTLQDVPSRSRGRQAVRNVYRIPATQIAVFAQVIEPIQGPWEIGRAS